MICRLYKVTWVLDLTNGSAVVPERARGKFSYKYFLLKRLSVNYRSKRVQELCKWSFWSTTSSILYTGVLQILFLWCFSRNTFYRSRMCNPFDWAVSVRYLLKLYACGILITCWKVQNWSSIDFPVWNNTSVQWLWLGSTYQCQSLCNRGCW